MKLPHQKYLSYAVSVLFLLLIVFKLHMNQKYEPNHSQLSSEKAVAKYLQQHFPALDSGQTIPTGVFVESVNFTDANTVHMSGYIWQHYSEEHSLKADIGIVFPEAINLIIKKSYQRKTDKLLTIGWYFEGSFVQKFDYTSYPFDYKKVWIRMWYVDFDTNKLLVPDLRSYDSTNPHDVLGIDDGIVLRDYSLMETYFSYKLANYDTNFGIPTYVGQKHFPELTFNIILKRNTVNALIINIIPIVMVVIFTYYVLLALTSERSNVGVFGCNYLNMQRSVTFLLFIVVVAHVQLRTFVFGQNITFLDYLYFITYFSLLYVSMVTTLAIKGDDAGWISRVLIEDNYRLPKLLFFPIILGLTLICCLIFL